MLEESTTYQATMRRGAIREAQEVILFQGHKRFGPASAETETALRGIQDLDRLHRLLERLLDVTTWDELLATP